MGQFGLSVRILNLYSGLGGNRQLWGDDNDITAVEMDPKIAKVYRKLYPADTLILGDAHEYLLQHYNEFDFIWSSPPCQSHSRMIRSGRNRKPRYPDCRLYEEILFLQNDFKGRWVVENVKPWYPALITPSLEMGRHYIWSNFYIPAYTPPVFKNFINTTNIAGSKELKKWLNINYEENIYYGKNHCPSQTLRNCVHPKTGLHIFTELLRDMLTEYIK